MLKMKTNVPEVGAGLEVFTLRPGVTRPGAALQVWCCDGGLRDTVTMSRVAPGCHGLTLSRPPDIGVSESHSETLDPRGKINWTRKKKKLGYLFQSPVLLWEICGQFYLHFVFTSGMLLMKLLYTRTFYRNVDSAKMRSCEKIINSVPSSQGLDQSNL